MVVIDPRHRSLLYAKIGDPLGLIHLLFVLQSELYVCKGKEVSMLNS